MHKWLRRDVLKIHKKAFLLGKALICIVNSDYAFLPEATRFLSILCSGRLHLGFSPKDSNCESSASTVLGCEIFVNGFCGFKPSISNIFISSFTSGLGVVNSLSPAKMEFAPAKSKVPGLRGSCLFFLPKVVPVCVA